MSENNEMSIDDLLNTVARVADLELPAGTYRAKFVNLELYGENGDVFRFNNNRPFVKVTIVIEEILSLGNSLTVECTAAPPIDNDQDLEAILLRKIVRPFAIDAGGVQYISELFKAAEPEKNTNATIGNYIRAFGRGGEYDQVAQENIPHSLDCSGRTVILSCRHNTYKDKNSGEKKRAVNFSFKQDKQN